MLGFECTGALFPFFPVYLLVWAYEFLVRLLDARSLMAYMMVTTER